MESEMELELEPRAGTGYMSKQEFEQLYSDSKKFHVDLMRFGHSRLMPATPCELTDWLKDFDYNHASGQMEIGYIESERKKIVDQAAQVPRQAQEFVDWFEELKQNGPGQNDSLFPWLATEATQEQMRWFIKQEVAGEAGFEDLVALTQLRMPVTAKLEMARNYWDEMGRGAEQGMHGPMLDRSVKELNLEDTSVDELIWEAMAMANLMIGFASNRRYAYHSVGALGVVELTAPTRTGYVADGLKRLKVSKQGFIYFSLHSTVDIKHSLDWNREVITPLVEQNPEVAPLIAEGALMRLRAGAECFERYRQHFGLSASNQSLYS